MRAFCVRFLFFLLLCIVAQRARERKHFLTSILYKSPSKILASPTICRPGQGRARAFMAPGGGNAVQRACNERIERE